MLGYLNAIFGCQLIGELFATATGLPIPGPVCGMAILFAALVIKGSIPPDLAAVGVALLDNLSLLFIPAAVGVMLHARLLIADWVPLSIALIISTALTIAVTAVIMSRLAPPAPATAPPSSADGAA